MSSTLEYRQVTKTYPNGDQPAVCEVDLIVEKGETLALVGESGSGKTTLLRLAAGLEAPDAGEILVGGETVADSRRWTPPEKRHVGMVFQDGALFPHLTAARNIAYGLRGKTREHQATTVDYMLAMVGLSGMSERYPHELSGGERQRLAVARALAPQPAVLLLDEPFSNLDPALRRSLRDEIARILKKLSATAIVVTHDTDDALAVGDRIAVFREGRLDQTGTPSEVYHAPANGYCARLFGPANEVPGVNGSDTRWVRPEDMTLVDAAPPENGHAVEILRVHNAGRCLEVTARPTGETDASSTPGDWLLHLPEDSSIHTGDEKWVVVG